MNKEWLIKNLVDLRLDLSHIEMRLDAIIKVVIGEQESELGATKE